MWLPLLLSWLLSSLLCGLLSILSWWVVSLRFVCLLILLLIIISNSHIRIIPTIILIIGVVTIIVLSSWVLLVLLLLPYVVTNIIIIMCNTICTVYVLWFGVNDLSFGLSSSFPCVSKPCSRCRVIMCAIWMLTNLWKYRCWLSMSTS
jgi:hypothetical protein